MGQTCTAAPSHHGQQSPARPPTHSPPASAHALLGDSIGWAGTGRVPWALCLCLYSSRTQGSSNPPWLCLQLGPVPHWGNLAPHPPHFLTLPERLRWSKCPHPTFRDEGYGSVWGHRCTHRTPLKTPALTREANGHKVGPRGQAHGHSKERQWDLLYHLQTASVRHWVEVPVAPRPVPPQPQVPQAPRTTWRGARACFWQRL